MQRTMQHLCFGSVQRCLDIVTHLSLSIIASGQGQQPVTHLAHTSSGSIHSVTSGRRSSVGVSSLSSHAFWTSPQTAPWFIRMHLWSERLKTKQDISVWTKGAQVFLWRIGEACVLKDSTCMPGLCSGFPGTSDRGICPAESSGASRQKRLLWLHPVCHAPRRGAWGSRLLRSPLSSWRLWREIKRETQSRSPTNSPRQTPSGRAQLPGVNVSLTTGRKQKAKVSSSSQLLLLKRFSHPARVPGERRALRLQLSEDRSSVFVVWSAAPCVHPGVETSDWKLLFAPGVVATASISEHWWADDTRDLNTVTSNLPQIWICWSMRTSVLVKYSKQWPWYCSCKSLEMKTAQTGTRAVVASNKAPRLSCKTTDNFSLLCCGLGFSPCQEFLRQWLGGM